MVILCYGILCSHLKAIALKVSDGNYFISQKKRDSVEAETEDWWKGWGWEVGVEENRSQTAVRWICGIKGRAEVWMGYLPLGMLWWAHTDSSEVLLTCPLAQLAGVGKRFRELERPEKQLCDIMSRWRPHVFCSDRGNFSPLPHCTAFWGILKYLVTLFSN